MKRWAGPTASWGLGGKVKCERWRPFELVPGVEMLVWGFEFPRPALKFPAPGCRDYTLHPDDRSRRLAVSDRPR
jgi:hypothetical protein